MEIRDVYALRGRTAYGADGDRLGTVSGAYLDNVTRRPSWITVERGGLFRTTRSFVPIEGVELVDDGVRVAVDGDAVKRAPQIEGDRVLSGAEEQELRAHYGLAGQGAPAPQRGTTQPEPDDDAAARDMPPSGSATAATPEQAAMTRSEERARVATETVPTSRAVLRKTRIVEDRTFSVPLGRDQVQVAYEPLPDSGPAPVTAQPPEGSPQAEDQAVADADDEGWVVLYEERLVVRTEWVPVERVRLRTAGVQAEEVVHVDLRRERIDVDVVHASDAPTATH
jgi:stress response protein YsnF